MLAGTGNPRDSSSARILSLEGIGAAGFEVTRRNERRCARPRNGAPDVRDELLEVLALPETGEGEKKLRHVCLPTRFPKSTQGSQGALVEPHRCMHQKVIESLIGSQLRSVQAQRQQMGVLVST